MNQVPNTDNKALSDYIRGKPYRQAIPNALPDAWIKPLARDLRQLQEREARADDHTRAVGPTMLAFHILRGRTQERTRRQQAELTFAESKIFGTFQVYQLFLEREMVTRILGIPSEGDEAAFVEMLDRVLDSADSYVPQVIADGDFLGALTRMMDPEDLRPPLAGR